MRISDWSSDVCSSDLVVADLYFAILQLHRIVCAGLDAALGAFRVRHVLQQDFRDARDIEFLLQLFPPGQWLGYMKLGLPPRSIDADRKSVVSGKSVSVRVDLGGRSILNKKIIKQKST